ncbi:PA14 domain-containing protein [Lachancea thermotolerans]
MTSNLYRIRLIPVLFQLLLLLLVRVSYAAKVDGGAILGCNPSKVSEGFHYLHGGYETFGDGKLGSSSGVTNVSFYTGTKGFSRCGTVNALLPPNWNYDKEISLSNFSMLLTGYFLPPVTGTYSLDLAYIDIEASLGHWSKGSQIPWLGFLL